MGTITVLGAAAVCSLAYKGRYAALGRAEDARSRPLRRLSLDWSCAVLYERRGSTVRAKVWLAVQLSRTECPYLRNQEWRAGSLLFQPGLLQPGRRLDSEDLLLPALFQRENVFPAPE